MVDSLLSIIQKAAARIGNIVVPSSVIGSTDGITAQLLAGAVETGEDLTRVYDWSATMKEGATFSLVAGQALYPLPADFDRMVPATVWDRSNMWRLIGPDDPQQARERVEGIVPSSPRRVYRQVGAFLSIYPTPAAADAGVVIAYDYVSRNYAQSSAGVLQSTFLADTDYPLLPDRLFVLGIKMRWRMSNGFDASSQMDEYMAGIDRAIASDKGGGAVLSMNPGCGGDAGLGNADLAFTGPIVSVFTQ